MRRKSHGGGRLGYSWDQLEVGKKVKYPGSYYGLKSHVWRLNHSNKWDRKFRSFRKGENIYIERLS